MNVRITRAFIKPFTLSATFPKAALVEKRLQYLSQTISQANAQNSIVLLILGDTENLLDIPEKDLKEIGMTINEFQGDVVILVSDTNDPIISNCKSVMDENKVFFIREDSFQNV